MSAKPTYEELEQKIQALESTIQGIESHGQERLQIITHDITEQKLTEEKLRNSERKYRHLVEGTDDLITMLNSKGQFIFVNHAAERVFGLRPDECIGVSAFSFVLPEDRQKTEAWFGKILAEKKESDVFENRQLSRQGHISHITWVSNFLYNEQGGLIHVSGIGRDTTKQKEAEAELRLQGVIAENLSEGIIMIRDSDLTIAYVNPVFEKIFGYAPGELIGRHISVINAPVHSSPQDKAADIHQALLANNRWKGEVPNISKDGTLFWSYVSITGFNHHVHGKVWVSLHTNITEQKLVADALQKSEERYRTLVETSSLGIQISDREGRIVLSNPAHHAIYGMEPETLVGRYVWDLIPSLTEKQYVQNYYKSLIENEPRPVPYFTTGTAADGGEIYLQIDWNYMRDQEGKVMALCSIINDITLLKEAEAALIRSRKFLTSVLDSIQDAICVTDTNLTILQVNRATRQDYQHVSGFIGKKCHAAFRGLSLPCRDCPSLKTIQSGTMAVSERLKTTENGDSTYLEIMAFPMFDERGKVVGVIESARDITARKKMEQELLEAKTDLEKKIAERTDSLEQKTRSLKETNIALKVLMEQRENDRNDLEQRMLFNVKNLITPYVDRIKALASNKEQLTFTEIIEENLAEILAPFATGIGDTLSVLSPAEIQIAGLVKQGKTTKEIAGLLHISPATVSTHRKKIRKKTGITNKKLNLQTILSSRQ